MVENNSIVVAVVVVEYNRIMVAVMVVVEYLEGVIYLQLDQNQIVYILYSFKNRNYFQFH